MRDGLGNLAARNVDQLAAIFRKPAQRIRTGPPSSTDLAQTGLSLTPATVETQTLAHQAVASSTPLNV